MKRHRWFGHPLALLTIIAALGLDFWSIPYGTSRSQSKIKRTVLNAILGKPYPKPGSPPPPPGLIIWQHDGQLVTRWRLSRPGRPDRVATVPTIPVDDTWDPTGTMHGPYSNTSGLYHPTRRRTTISLSSWPTGPTTERMMALYVEAFDTLPDSADPIRNDPAFAHTRTLCAAGKTEGTKPLPAGYARNTLTLALLTLLLALPILGRTDLWLAPRLLRMIRMIRRRQPWQCQRCGYDTTGLEQCPECGTPVEGDA